MTVIKPFQTQGNSLSAWRQCIERCWRDLSRWGKKTPQCIYLIILTMVSGSNHNATFQVILVELEEITPAQLALFPESVRHLRKKQGAVCWWKKSQRQRWRKREDEEKAGKDLKVFPSLSPSSRFWKEMRYYMPVRGKREVYPEKTALLNIKLES